MAGWGCQLRGQHHNPIVPNPLTDHHRPLSHPGEPITCSVRVEKESSNEFRQKGECASLLRGHSAGVRSTASSATARRRSRSVPLTPPSPPSCPPSSPQARFVASQILHIPFQRPLLLHARNPIPLHHRLKRQPGEHRVVACSQPQERLRHTSASVRPRASAARIVASPGHE